MFLVQDNYLIHLGNRLSRIHKKTSIIMKIKHWKNHFCKWFFVWKVLRIGPHICMQTDTAKAWLTEVLKECY